MKVIVDIVVLSFAAALLSVACGPSTPQPVTPQPAAASAAKPEASPNTEARDRMIKILKYGEQNTFYKPSKTDAAIALGLLGDPTTIDVIIEHVQNEPEEHLRSELIKALGWMRARRAVPVLIEVLYRDSYIMNRKYAKLALEEIAGEQAMKALREWEQSPEGKRDMEEERKMHEELMRELEEDDGDEDGAGDD